jgi:hypothetical protein
MERAFAAGQVELPVAGDWEDVQIEMGLRQTRATPKPNYAESIAGPDLAAQFAAMTQRLQRETMPSSSGSVQRRKAKKRDKRKQQEPRSKGHKKQR